MITEENIKLVQNSWLVIVGKANEAGQIFYDYLFRNNPELRYLFPTDTRSQNRKLIMAIALIVNKIERMENIHAEITWLASKHLAYGVEVKHFVPFKEAFMYMIEQVLSSEDFWDRTLQNAWEVVFSEISQAIIVAMQNLESQKQIARIKIKL
ncbi:MAG: globin domain-containing protein [Microscillaceae bacterium]|nr:globin domain-containing protein [Microscillaceae bacterium]MDW8460112.1 globin domain-containing protein [Cytophagales bacterium]